MTLWKIVKDLMYQHRGKDRETIYALCTERLIHMGLGWGEYRKAINILNNELKRRVK